MLIDSKEILEKLEKTTLPYFQYKEIKDLVESCNEVRAIPISFIATQVIKLEKLVDYERYEKDQYDSRNYHKLQALRELLDEFKKTD